MRVIATAGHVDHGKSTLVTALTGIDPDRFEEEKRRGLTIDLGFAWLTLPSGLEIGIVDVPGHERFIRNMLAGVGAVDAVLFVVAADEGWMPQSAEHLQILDFLGVERGVVALTKTDTAGELADEAELDVREHLTGTPFEDTPIVRVSAKTGDGLDDLVNALDAVLGDAPAPEEDQRVRLWIDRSFSIKGAGTVVTGTLEGGPLRIGQEVRIVPDGRSARIRSMQTHGQQAEVATGPRRLAVNLVGLDRRLVHRGDALVADEWVVSDRFAARLRPSGDDFKERGAYELFVGSAQASCRLRSLSDERDPLVEIFTSRQLPIIPSDRFVIRDVGRWATVAGGVVIDAQPSKLRRDDEAVLTDLRTRETLRGGDLAAWIVRKRGVVTWDELRAASGLGDATIGDGVSEASGFSQDGYIFARETERSLYVTIVDALREFHAQHPLEGGMPFTAVQELAGIPSGAFDVWIADMQEDHVLIVDGSLLRLPEHSGTELSADDRLVADRALDTLRDAATSPPELRDVGLSAELARALERNGKLVFLTPTTAYPADVWHDIERRVVGFIVDNGSATVAQIRDAVGTTRKYAVPLLEKLDATGVTRRKGDVRELGPRGRELAER